MVTEWITLRVAAGRMRCSRQWVQQLVREGRIKARMIVSAETGARCWLVQAPRGKPPRVAAAA